MCHLSSIHLVKIFFHRTEYLKTCTRPIVMLPEIPIFFLRKIGLLRARIQTSLGHAKRISPIPVHAGLATGPTANAPLLCTHSSEQSFPFPSFETKQFPQKYDFRHKIGNSTKQTEMFCFKY